MKSILAVLWWILTFQTLLTGAQGSALRQIRTVPLGGVEGRIDHLAVDVPHQRLYVAALGNGSLEVIDLEKGERVQSLGGLREPQGVAVSPELLRIFVACGGDGSLQAFDAQTFKPAWRVAFSSDADNLRYDVRMKRLYLGYGEGAIAILDASTGAKIGEVPLPGHPESFQLEKSGSRIFVNIPTAHQIAVIDRTTLEVVARWELHGASSNFPMALDEADRRLFVGCRHPASLVVFDTQSGKQIASLPSAGDADDLFYDSQRKKIYLSGGEGFLDVFDCLGADRYKREEHPETAPGARTSLFVPESGLLCVAFPRRGNRSAEIRVYRVQP
jgi:hypothetical protein